MDLNKLDAALTDLVEKRIVLNALSYSDKTYDEVEDDLHDSEDDFLDEFGNELEEVLEKVHEKHFPDNDVLIPTAYLAKNYVKKGKNPDGSDAYDVTSNEGILVESDKYRGKIVRLVLIPNPARLVVTVDGKGKEIVWNSSSN